MLKVTRPTSGSADEDSFRPSRRAARRTWLVCLALVLAACGDPDEPDPDGDYTPIMNKWTPDPSQCENEDYDFPLEVSTAVREEVDYLENVVACAADPQYGPLWLHNVGNEAWFLNANSAVVRYVFGTARADLLASGYPDDMLLLPEDVVVISQPPAQVSWDLSAAATVAWETEGEAIDQAAALGTAILEREMKKQHPKGAAALACALAAGTAAEAASDRPEEFEEILATSLGLAAGGGKCATNWKSVWGERFAPATGFLERSGTQFRIYNRLARILTIVAR